MIYEIPAGFIMNVKVVYQGVICKKKIMNKYNMKKASCIAPNLLVLEYSMCFTKNYRPRISNRLSFVEQCLREERPFFNRRIPLSHCRDVSPSRSRIGGKKSELTVNTKTI